MFNVLTAGVLAAVVLTGPTAPGDTASPTSQPAHYYELPASLEAALVYNPAVDAFGGSNPEPGLDVIERPGCDVENADRKPNLTLRLLAPITMDDPAGGPGEVVLDAGDYPGGVCDNVQAEKFIDHPEFGIVGTADSFDFQPRTVWTAEQVTAMIDAADQSALATDSSGRDTITLRADPYPEADPVAILLPDTQLEVGLPVMGQPVAPQIWVSDDWQPVRVNGQIGWLPTDQVLPFPGGGLAGSGVRTEVVTVGTVASRMDDQRGIEVLALRRGADLSDPYLGRGTVLGYLQAGDQVTASAEMYEAKAGLGWTAVAMDASRVAELPEETRYLGQSGRLVELPDGQIGWAYAYLTLDAEAVDQAAAPTDAGIPTIGAPADDEATATGPVPPSVTAAPVDPMTIAFTTAVERRGSKAGLPSTFSILSQPTDGAPTLGVLTEGQVYRASAAFTGDESLTHADLWRAIELTDAEGTVTRAFVHADDVLETARPAPTVAPTAGTGVIDTALEKGGELGGVAAAKWDGRDRGGWNPLRTVTNTIALLIGGVVALLSAGLLVLGGYRASVVAGGGATRAGFTPVGRIAALAPTVAGTVLAAVSAWLLPSTTTGWVIAGVLALLAGGVVMTRLSSRNGRLAPDLTGVTWDRLALHLAPALVLGALAWWLLGGQVAAVLSAVAVGAGLALAGKHDEPETDDEVAPEPEQPVSVPAGGSALDLTGDEFGGDTSEQ